jgi:hypothetical protein
MAAVEVLPHVIESLAEPLEVDDFAFAQEF